MLEWQEWGVECSCIWSASPKSWWQICFARLLGEMLISILNAEICASILFCILSTGTDLLRNEAACLAWSICPGKGRQISQSPPQCDRCPCSCSLRWWRVPLFTNWKHCLLLPGVGELLTLALLFLAQSFKSYQSRITSLKAIAWTCSTSFGHTWDFGTCLACRLERYKW